MVALAGFVLTRKKSLPRAASTMKMIILVMGPIATTPEERLGREGTI